MSIRRLYGTGTIDAGVFWENKIDEKGWRIQYNSTLDNFSFLKPFRLLDPSGNLWASADSLKEMIEALPELSAEFSKKTPLFSGDEFKSFVRVAGAIIATAALSALKDKLDQ